MEENPSVTIDVIADTCLAKLETLQRGRIERKPFNDWIEDVVRNDYSG